MPRSSPQISCSDFAARRESLVGEGAPAVLPFVPVPADGLLAALPLPPPGSPDGWPWNVQTPPPDATATDWPEIFVAVPSYRQGDYIEAALRSILLQNYPRLRLVVLDAASPDGTARVLDRYRPWLSFARSAPDRGQAHALNLAFSLAGDTGLLGWLNSDDLFLPGALFAVARAHLLRGSDFIYGDGLSLDQSSGRVALDRAGFAHPRFRRYPGAIYSHAVFWSAALRLPFREDLHCALDYELWIRLLPATRRRLHLPARSASSASTAPPNPTIRP